MIRAILFDKDGTLTDFRRTWEAWLPGAMRDLAVESSVDVDGLLHRMGLDPVTGRIQSDAPFVTATNDETMAAFEDITGWSGARLLAWWTPRVRAVPQVPVTDTAAFLRDLRARGLKLGVLTNADEGEARRHLGDMGCLDCLDLVIGCDSGHGPKPAPGGALAFADGLGLKADEVVLVGDGLTDMGAARAAGMRAVAVLTGTLDAAALTPHAEAVLPDITYLPNWLDRALDSPQGPGV